MLLEKLRKSVKVDWKQLSSVYGEGLVTRQ